jgi:hypothetical protein
MNGETPQHFIVTLIMFKKANAVTLEKAQYILCKVFSDISDV